MMIPLTAIQQNIATIAQLNHRNPHDILLLAVTKGQSIDTILQALSLGLNHFGENYLQEALPKIHALANQSISWHFLGAIQSNKCKDIAKYFDWVHTLSRKDIATRLNDYRGDNQSRLNVCIQLNIDEESTKSGIAPVELLPLAKHILTLKYLHLRGLMVIPKADNSPQKTLQTFLTVAKINRELAQNLSYPLDTLSMGMSNDYPLAIEAGSTLLRLGRALFEKRD